MNWENLKNRIQQNASQQEVKVDVDDIWAAIEPEVDLINEQKRKRRFFFFWLVGLLIALSVGGLYYVDNKNLNDSAIVDFEKKEKTNTEEISTFEPKMVGEKNKPISTKTANNKTPKAQNKTQSIIDNSKENKKINIQNTATLFDQSTDENLLNRNNSSSSQEAQTIVESDKSNLSFSKNENRNVYFNQQLNNKIDKKELIDILNPLPFSTINLPTPEYSFLPLTLAKEEIDVAESTIPNFNFSFGLMGGIGMAFKNLDTRDNTSNSLLSVRKETESSLETTQLGVSFSLRHFMGFSLSSGLVKTTFVENVKFDDTITEVNDIQGIKVIRVDPNGDTTFVLGAIPETKVSTIEKNLYVRYKLLEVPIILGWQTKDKNGTRWTWGIEGGIVPNLSFTTKGIILNENYEDVNLGTEQDRYFKKNIGLSYHLGFSANRRLNRNIELSFKPTFRYFLNDFSVIGNPISQKYILVGGQLGANYIF